MSSFENVDDETWSDDVMEIANYPCVPDWTSDSVDEFADKVTARESYVTSKYGIS